MVCAEPRGATQNKQATTNKKRFKEFTPIDLDDPLARNPAAAAR
jgi:hypothetical protein